MENYNEVIILYILLLATINESDVYSGNFNRKSETISFKEHYLSFYRFYRILFH